jgi:hypothetical protein
VRAAVAPPTRPASSAVTAHGSTGRTSGREPRSERQTPDDFLASAPMLDEGAAAGRNSSQPLVAADGGRVSTRSVDGPVPIRSDQAPARNCARGDATASPLAHACAQTPQRSGATTRRMGRLPASRLASAHERRSTATPMQPVRDPAANPRLGLRERNGETPAKDCRRCGETKPAGEFRRNPRTRDRLSSWCSECHNAASRRWRARVRDERDRMLDERRRAHLEALRAQRWN